MLFAFLMEIYLRNGILCDYSKVIYMKTKHEKYDYNNYLNLKGRNALLIDVEPKDEMTLYDFTKYFKLKEKGLALNIRRPIIVRGVSPYNDGTEDDTIGYKKNETSSPFFGGLIKNHSVKRAVVIDLNQLHENPLYKEAFEFVFSGMFDGGKTDRIIEETLESPPYDKFPSYEEALREYYHSELNEKGLEDPSEKIHSKIAHTLYEDPRFSSEDLALLLYNWADERRIVGSYKGIDTLISNRVLQDASLDPKTFNIHCPSLGI